MRAKQPETQGKLDRDGVKLHYEVYGEGEHTILFLAPNWPLVSSRCYKAQIPYFSEHFKCVTFDPRGNGKSDKPIDPKSYSLDCAVKDALAVLDETGTDKAILVGLSASGALCAALAAYHPGRVQAMITFGTVSPFGPNPEPRNVADYNHKFDDPQGWEKHNLHYWRENFPDYADFFTRQVFNEAHSTKQIEDCIEWMGQTSGEILIAAREAALDDDLSLDEDVYKSIKCPVLAIHGDKDAIITVADSQIVAELTGGELVVIPGIGHNPQGRIPAKVNVLVRDFLARKLGTWKPEKKEETPVSRKTRRPKKALYLSSPIGLGHARRDLAITQELRKLHPDLEVDWLSQDPVTRFLKSNDERVHPASVRLANESSHIESESGEHDLHCFQALRNMDEILIANFMIFQEILEQENYDLVIGDEAWDVDHYWHEHPDMKKTQLAWLTDFVGFLPMASGGDHEAFLTTDYNAEMIGHVEGHPALRDRSIFVGNPADIVPASFGADLPDMRDWIPQHFDFSGYVLGTHPSHFAPRDELRSRFGYKEDEKVCIVTVGGSGVGAPLIRRILAAWPIAQRKIPELRMVLVTGPRLDPALFDLPQGVEARSFVPGLDQHLASCDLALVQGGLATTMELAAAGTPFIYFPLRNHFEQNFCVAHRLDQYGAGRKMIYDEATPDMIAQAIIEEITKPRAPKPVESDGATRAAKMLSDLL